jgi:hypothetical protein
LISQSRGLGDVYKRQVYGVVRHIIYGLWFYLMYMGGLTEAKFHC